MKNCYVYILCSRKNGTLYIGVTNDLNKRIQTHRANIISGFTKKYGVYRLVYFEVFETADAAIHGIGYRHPGLLIRGQLIEKVNPTWRDLFNSAAD